MLAFMLPSTFTLFPYTTLFRSRLVDRLVRGLAALALGFERKVDHHDRLCARRDRKSTRLNSSHVSTSYAVFCLKKKTLDFVGYPRFPAPVDFIAAVIAYYVHPV